MLAKRMSIRERLSGNEAVAYAMKQINPDVMGAYPITPSTEIPQYFSAYVDNGEVDTDFIAVGNAHGLEVVVIGLLIRLGKQHQPARVPPGRPSSSSGLRAGRWA